MGGGISNRFPLILLFFVYAIIPPISSYADNPQHFINNVAQSNINQYSTNDTSSPAVSNDNDSNIDVSVPTRVPCIVKADGTIIAPSSDTWQIRNNSTSPVTISSISTDNLLKGTTISAKSQATSLYDDTTGLTGSYAIDISDAGSKVDETNGKEDNPIQIVPQQSIGFDWNVNIGSENVHDMTSGVMTLANVSFRFKVLKKTAFAVYSEDDNSLDFYKRLNVPNSGDIFNGKAVSNVYTGFENDSYTSVASPGGFAYDDNAIVNTPWYDKREKIQSVEVIDNNIKPKDISFWFQNFHQCNEFQMNKLDTSNIIQMINTFDRCYKAIHLAINQWDVSHIKTIAQAFLNDTSLEEIDLSGWRTSSLQSLASTWNGCAKLKKLDIGNGWDVSNVVSLGCTFDGTAFEKLDLSTWNFKKNNINLYATFAGMTSLKELDISSIDNSNATFLGNQVDTMFIYTFHLSKITVSNKWSWEKSWTHLLIPDKQHIPNSDGKWYSLATGKGYSSSDLPSNVADTYVVSKDLM